MDYEVVLSERCRGISLVSSEDPNIQMWIMGRCVCRYTAQMESLCALAVFFSFFRRFPARLGRPVPGTKGRVLGCRRRVVHARWCATGRGARRRVVLLVRHRCAAIGLYFSWISGRPRPRGLGLRESAALRGSCFMDDGVVC